MKLLEKMKNCMTDEAEKQKGEHDEVSTSEDKEYIRRRIQLLNFFEHVFPKRKLL